MREALEGGTMTHAIQSFKLRRDIQVTCQHYILAACKFQERREVIELLIDGPNSVLLSHEPILTDDR
jgi:hypothetical protein